MKTQTYKELNTLATQGGTVIVGTGEDYEIPICELKQAFSLEGSFYNRSLPTLSIRDAADFYAGYVSELYPETVLLHIGSDDTDFLSDSPEDFDGCFRHLIKVIRQDNPKCRIVIVSMKNYLNDALLNVVNKHLKYIADSEKCEYEDISKKRIWNSQSTKDVVSFVYSIGFVRSLKNMRSVYDLVKILFCFEPKQQTN